MSEELSELYEKYVRTEAAKLGMTAEEFRKWSRIDPSSINPKVEKYMLAYLRLKYGYVS